jgi:hypothetical protein
MDASKITELRQRQANRYINRAKVVDASTLTWQRQIESSKYVASQAPVSDLATCTAGGAQSFTTVGTQGVGPGAVLLAGTTNQYYVPPAAIYPNPFRSAKGSAGSYVSCDQIAYMRAGMNSCCVAPVSVPPLLITLPTRQFSDGDIFYPGGSSNLYVPPGADISGNWLNPYLPLPNPYNAYTAQTFESYYKVNRDPSQNNYQTATYVHDPVVSSLQNGTVVYSTVAPNIVFIPTNNGTGRGTLVEDGFTEPRSTDPRSLP